MARPGPPEHGWRPQRLLLLLLSTVTIAAEAGCPARTPLPITNRCDAFRSQSRLGLPPSATASSWLLRSPVPPLLISQAGAGNTMVRLLVDYLTGLQTGSVFNDTTLGDLLPGELACPLSTLVVKSHLYIDHPPTGAYDPRNVSLEPITSMYYSSNHAKTRACAVNTAAWPAECGQRSGSSHAAVAVNSAIVVYRNPFEAAWSEAQRQMAHKSGDEQEMQDAHVAAIDANSLSPTAFHNKARSLIMRAVRNWQWYQIMRESSEVDVHFVDFYDLQNATTRVGTMEGILNHLFVTPSGEPVRLSNEDMACARAYAESAHRVVAASSDDHAPSRGAVLKEVFTPGFAKYLWTHGGLAKAWAIAGKMGLRWHMGVGDLERTFLPPQTVAKFLPATPDH